MNQKKCCEMIGQEVHYNRGDDIERAATFESVDCIHQAYHILEETDLQQVLKCVEDTSFMHTTPGSKEVNEEIACLQEQSVDEMSDDKTYLITPKNSRRGKQKALAYFYKRESEILSRDVTVVTSRTTLNEEQATTVIENFKEEVRGNLTEENDFRTFSELVKVKANSIFSKDVQETCCQTPRKARDKMDRQNESSFGKEVYLRNVSVKELDNGNDTKKRAEEMGGIEEEGSLFSFSVDVPRLVSIMNQKYDNRDVFLKELIVNSFAALRRAQKLRGRLKGEEELAVNITIDTENSCLVIADNGLGMQRDEFIKSFGMIQPCMETRINSLGCGSRSLVNNYLGFGFFTSYLVAHRVTVQTKHPSCRQLLWQWLHDDTYSVTYDVSVRPLTRGTRIVLHLKEECHCFLQRNQVTAAIRKFLQSTEFPIRILVDGGDKQLEEKRSEDRVVKESAVLESFGEGEEEEKREGEGDEDDGWMKELLAEMTMLLQESG